MDYNSYILNSKELILYIGLGVVIVTIIIFTFYRNLWIYFVALPFSVLVPFYQRKVLMNKRKRQLKLEFKEGILMIASSLSAGYSIENAITASIKELNIIFGINSLIAKEFLFISYHIKNNRPVEEVFLAFSQRSGIEEIESFAKVLAMAKRSGGELVPVITYTANMIRDKLQVQEEIYIINASKQLEQKIMNIIPFLLILYLNITSPGFFDLMYQTIGGKIIMTIFLIVYFLACFLSKKIMNIEV